MRGREKKKTNWYNGCKDYLLLCAVYIRLRQDTTMEDSSFKAYFSPRK